MLVFIRDQLFFPILNMSFTGGVVILAVVLARLALRRMPKVWAYALWGVVLFRLLCPVSLSGTFSLLGAIRAPAVENTGGVGSVVTYVEPGSGTVPGGLFQGIQEQLPILPDDEPAVGDEGERLPIQHPSFNDTQVETGKMTKELVISWICWAWLAGVIAMAAYALVSYFRLRRRLREAVRLEGALYLCDQIGSPFVLGLIRPKIYLPVSLKQEEMPYILLHERYHICRGDPVWRMLAYLALCLHWFNPLVWLAFVLSGRDMEMSCDEAVLKKLGGHIRADYSASLLSLSTGRTLISGTPLAFGEGDTKQRIHNLLRWRKPSIWLTGVALALCLVVVTACAVNPRAVESPKIDLNDPNPAQSAGGIDLSGESKIPDVTLLGEAEDGVYRQFRLTWGDAETTFDGSHEQGWDAPRCNAADVDQDSRKEPIVVLAPGHGTGLLVEELHIFDPDTLEEYDCTGLFDALAQTLSFQADQNYYYIHTPEGSFSLNKNELPNVYGDHNRLLEQIAVGNYLRFSVGEDGVVCVVGCEHELLNYCGYLTVRLSLTEEGFVFYDYRYTAADPGVLKDYVGSSEAALSYQNLVSGLNYHDVDLGVTWTLSQLSASYGTTGSALHAFAMADVNGDGAQEMVVRLMSDGGTILGYKVLWFDGGTLYGCDVPVRGLRELKTDGTFSYFDGVNDQGIARLSFTSQGYALEPLTYSQSDDGDTVFWYVDSTPTSREDFWAALEGQSGKPEVSWYVWYVITP